MTSNACIQLLLFLGVLLACVKPLGWYMARVYRGELGYVNKFGGRMEHGMFWLAGIDHRHEMSWREYALALLTFNAAGFLAVYLVLRLQGWLPLNPQDLANLSPALSFNVAVSFATNTNWQSYGGETTLSYFSQMIGLTVQNFVSAATGMSVLVALTRGFARGSSVLLGNFWVDLVRSTLYILLPLSLMLALALVSQGVVQSLAPFRNVEVIDPAADSSTQLLPMGPAASQIAIKQLGTNGGGFFNVNSSHPYENPTPLSNFLELLAILLIPAALCYTFGDLVGDKRQGWAVLAAMLVIFVPLTIGVIAAEQQGVPAIAQMGVMQAPDDMQSGGHLEGKEVRFGIVNSGLWAAATTAASNGSVNSMHDSYTPLGGLVPMWLMQLGEVVFGGVGSGLYGMLVFVMVAVFISGLMVGRTPAYLGKKIEAFEMKMAALVILVPPLVVLIGTALAVLGPGLSYTDPAGETLATQTNPGAHGFSEILYAFSSAGNNNGSAFAGLTTDTSFYNLALGLAMLLSRFWLIVPVLAIAGSLGEKKFTAQGAGTLQTHTPLFVVLIVGTVLLVGALTFVPALALGPIVEHLQMHEISE